MLLVCLDLEGVLIPEIWVGVAERTGIDALHRTTRDEPDYDKLMRYRLNILEQNNLGIREIQETIKGLDPLPGAIEFLEELKIEIPSKNILSDRIQEFSKKEIITIHLSNRWLNKYYDINNLINLIGKLQKTTKYLFFLTTENLGYEVFNDLISQYK